MTCTRQQVLCEVEWDLHSQSEVLFANESFDTDRDPSFRRPVGTIMIDEGHRPGAIK